MVETIKGNEIYLPDFCGGFNSLLLALFTLFSLLQRFDNKTKVKKEIKNLAISYCNIANKTEINHIFLP
jgi:hypothetical protein